MRHKFSKKASTYSCNLVETGGALALGVARELFELSSINIRELGADELAGQRAESIVESSEDGEGDVRLDLGSSLVRETSEVVVLRERACVEDTAGQVADVDASEGVDLAGVAAYVEELGVKESGVGDIGDEVLVVVGVFDGATVPVERNPLVALLDSVAARRSRDAEPVLEDVVVEEAVGVGLAVVGHEAVDEGVRSRLHQHSSEGSVEEVRVLGDLIAEAF